MTPQQAQSLWRLHDLSAFAQTRTSTLWRATHPEFGSVVLKILTPYGADEVHGFDLMQKAAGRGMARLFARETGAALMEYLSGPTLADMVRGGDTHPALLLCEFCNGLWRIVRVPCYGPCKMAMI